MSEQGPDSHMSERPAEGSLYQQIKLARFWLPVAIVGVVLVHQLFIVPLGDDSWRFWSQLLFYSILGPIVTFLTLNWIASEVRQREEAQSELEALYGELQSSHALLGAIQKVTEKFAAALDLEAVISAASHGITEVTGANGTAIVLGASGLNVTRGHALDAALMADAAQRDLKLAHGEVLAEPLAVTEGLYVLSASLRWGGKFEGSVHAYYPRPPGPEQRESFSILSSEFSAAAEATRSRARDLITLFEVDRSIRAEGNLERLLSALLSQTVVRADASIGGVYLADEERLLQLRAWHGLAEAPTQMSLRLGEGLIGKVAAGAEPRIVNRLSAEERSGAILAAAGSAVGLPLLAEQELLGVVILAHEHPHHFDEANLPFLSLLAGQVSLAVRNARAYLQSEELAIAEERVRIAREIHDGIAQSLAFAALKLELVQRLTERQPKQAMQELDGAKATIRETIREVRRSIFALRPIELERHGFIETIRRYSSDYGQQNNMQVTLDIQDAPQLTLKSEAALFRIFQEAMNNVAKHAGARTVSVTISKTEDGHASITVEDDGRGFDLDSVSDRVTSAGGLGLRQMRERMEGRGGHFEISSSPNEGTRMTASLPE